MSIPNSDNTGRNVYRRKPGKAWENMLHVGEGQSFR
jgi:hypothetical protein